MTRGVSPFSSALREENTSGRRPILGLALALFAAFFGFTLFVNDPIEAPALIYALPIGLLAFEFGVAWGLVGGLAAMALYTSVVLIEDQMVGPIGFLTRALAFAFIGAGFGLLASRVRGSEARVRSIIEASHEAFIAMNAEGEITDWNAAAEGTFGWSKAEVVGRRLGDTIIPPQLRSAHEEGLRRYLATGHASVLEQRLELSGMHRDGHEFPVEFSITAAEVGGPFHAFLRDISERKEREGERDLLLAKVEAIARTDELTGLPNRRAWEEELRRETARAHRTASPLCVAMVDIDRFKAYNDEHGHQAGDRLLREAAASWRIALRQTDLIARYGGEEFAVLLPDCPLDEAAAVADRMRRATPCDECCTVGVAALVSEESPETLMGRADEALYEGKRAGRDRVVLSDGP